MKKDTVFLAACLMVMTKTGKVIFAEAKVDYLDNDNSRAKLDLGRKWQDLCGPKFRYFMVFKNKDLGLEGAYTLDYFTEIMKEL